jgi:G patch domain/KOW motif-containing protein
VIKPVLTQLRPKGLGLGADRSLVEQKKGAAHGKGGTKTEELRMRIGALVRVAPQDLYGKVESTDEDNRRCLGNWEGRIVCDE